MVPDNIDEQRGQGQGSIGKDQYKDVIARRKAIQITRDKEKERERINKEKVDIIRKLINKDPQEYNR